MNRAHRSRVARALGDPRSYVFTPHGVCRSCCASGPVSPSGRCAECVSRAIAENPIALEAAKIAARMFDDVGLDGDKVRTMTAVFIALGFLGRCRK